MHLRPYQQTAVDQLRASYAAGRRAPLFVLPTGGGKTFVFSHVANNATARGNRVCILVHRQELLFQASRSLTAVGVAHGLIAPGHNQTQHAVQVASVQTLSRRLAKRSYDFDLCIIDEAHHAAAGTWLKITQALPNARILGVTATPIRSDGQGLSAVFDDMVIGPSMGELIEMGFLVRPEVYAPPTAINLAGVRKRGGDFDQRDVAERMDKPIITGSAVDHYRKLCPSQPAIAFCASVEHARHVAAQFNSAGFRAMSVDGSMLDSERKAAIDGLGNGKLHVVTSCDIISEGTDIPVVSAAILLRPTQSTGLYIQQVGRALRTAPGKDKAIILDHVGNVLRHGMPDEPRDWSLDGIERGNKAANDNVAPVKQCSRCFAVYRPAPACPQCGHVEEVKARTIEETDGELKQITPEEAARMQRERRMEVATARTMEDLLEVAKRRGYAPGWAYHMMRHRNSRG